LNEKVEALDRIISDESFGTIVYEIVSENSELSQVKKTKSFFYSIGDRFVTNLGSSLIFLEQKQDKVVEKSEPKENDIELVSIDLPNDSSSLPTSENIENRTQKLFDRSVSFTSRIMDFTVSKDNIAIAFQKTVEVWTLDLQVLQVISVIKIN
jgi:hypothetical protein